MCSSDLPTSGPFFLRLASFVKLTLLAHVPVSAARKLFQKDKRTKYEALVMRLAGQALLSTAEDVYKRQIEGGDVCNAHSLDLQRQRFDAKSGNALIVLFAGFQQIKGLQTRKMGVKMVIRLVYLLSCLLYTSFLLK